jgi:hypothetical protein
VLLVIVDNWNVKFEGMVKLVGNVKFEGKLTFEGVDFSFGGKTSHVFCLLICNPSYYL